MRRPGRVRPSVSFQRHSFPRDGVAGTPADPLRRDDDVPRAGGVDRPPDGVPCGRPGERPEPHRHRGAVPPGAGQQRIADRLRGWGGVQAEVAGAGAGWAGGCGVMCGRGGLPGCSLGGGFGWDWLARGGTGSAWVRAGLARFGAGLAESAQGSPARSCFRDWRPTRRTEHSPPKPRAPSTTGSSSRAEARPGRRGSALGEPAWDWSPSWRPTRRARLAESARTRLSVPPATEPRPVRLGASRTGLPRAGPGYLEPDSLEPGRTRRGWLGEIEPPPDVVPSARSHCPARLKVGPGSSTGPSRLSRSLAVSRSGGAVPARLAPCGSVVPR